jgi:hypothetical protein
MGIPYKDFDRSDLDFRRSFDIKCATFYNFYCTNKCGNRKATAETAGFAVEFYKK